MTSCMSFNILGSDSTETISRKIPTRDIRCAPIVSLIQSYNADIICIQEAKHASSLNWLDLFTKNLSNSYRSISYESEAGTTQKLSTGLMILFKPDLFELVDHGYQDYSSTEKQPRSFIWARLRDLRENKIIYVTNTHWSINWDSEGNISIEAGDEHRTKQANELLSFWEREVGSAALLGCGDYNCSENTKWYDLLSRCEYKDAYTVVENPSEKYGRGVDHCFVNPESMCVTECQRIRDTFEYEGRMCRYSDHYPILLKVNY